MLEQIAYEIPRAQERKQIVYQIGDLESLSATALYYGDGSSSGSSSGFGGGFGGFGIVERKDKKKGPSSGGPVPRSIGSFSDFKPSSSLGIGSGIAKEIEGFIERYRAPEIDNKHGEHINLLSYLPKKTKPFFNLHIDINDDKE